MFLNKYCSNNKLIEYYFFVRGDYSDYKNRELQFFPDGSSIIVFNFGSDFVEGQNILPRKLLSATCTETHYLKLKKGCIDILGIKLKPYGLYPFLQNNISAISSRIINLEVLFGEELSGVVELLLQKDEPLEKVEFLDNYLLSKIIREVPTLIQTLIEELDISSDDHSVFSLATKYHVSTKTIQRLFNQYIGISPKKYLRLHKLVTMIRLMKEKKEFNLSGLTYELGYSDQSHFIKEFYEFTKLKPSLFQKNIPMSDFYNFELFS